VLARVATIMAKNRMSIASVIQSPSETPGLASLVLTTHESDERSMRVALRALSSLGSVREAPLLLRIGDLGD
jgi:homoserine dehydrogenase